MKKNLDKKYKLDPYFKKNQYEIDSLINKKKKVVEAVAELQGKKNSSMNEIELSQRELRQMLLGQINTLLYGAATKFIEEKKNIINKFDEEIQSRQKELMELERKINKLFKIIKGLEKNKDDHLNNIKSTKKADQEKKVEELFLTNHS